MKDKLIIGTRGSKLALWQSNHVADRLKQLTGLPVELKTIKTQGDKILDSPLAKIGDKGLFVKEIENALLDGQVDLAVHSLKDVPTQIPSGLILGAILERKDFRDVLISRNNVPLAELDPGSIIGTSSLRRRAQILNFRPDFEVADVRGNLDTRVRKIEAGLFDGIILAAAGLDRMGWQDRITERISSEVMLSAVGQGAIAIEIRQSDSFVSRVVGQLDHFATRAATTAERAFLRVLEGGCQVPIGALGKLKDGALTLDGLVANLSGANLLRGSIEGNPEEADRLGTALAEELLERGADKILAEVREQAEADLKDVDKDNNWQH